MTQTLTRYEPASWTAPTEADDRAWDALTREEQVEALRTQLNSRDCTTTVATIVEDIVRRARANRASRDGDGL